jgi:hypothetical protein
MNTFLKSHGGIDAQQSTVFCKTLSRNTSTFPQSGPFTALQ